MLTTMELRWFKPGTLPPEVKDWFAAKRLGTNLGNPEEREDSYLYIPHYDFLNVKTRQGRLEIKLRKAELDVLRFGDRVEGQLEQWTKWVCEDAAAERAIAPEVVQKKPWVTVQKMRWQRHYQVSHDAASPIPVEESVSPRCSVEITQMIVKKQTWWSLAFEASGDDIDLTDNLKAVASWVFQTYHEPILQAQDSYGYPHWLSDACS